MSADPTALHRLFQTLAQHAGIIAQAYFGGSVQPDEDNTRALNQLKQLKVLAHHGADGYRLSTRLSQFLDSALNSDRLRRLDTDLGGWVDLLEQQIGLYQDAHAENRLEDCDSYLAEIERLVFDLADTLDENTAYLLMLVNSRFANVRTLSEKKRQNAFYITRLEQLVAAVSGLQPSFLLDLAEPHEPLQSLIERQIAGKLPAHRQRLQDILDILKTFLFQLRQIEARARLVRGFAFYLRQNPGYLPEDWSQRDPVPELWNQARPLALKAHPDTLDHGVEAELAAIARKLRVDESALLAKKKERTLNRVSFAKPEPRRLEIPAFRRRLRELFEQARSAEGAPLSALAYRNRHVPEIEAPIWLSCVLGEALRREGRRQPFRYQLVKLERHDGFTGNSRVKDVLLTYRQQ
jgi:hypothetical protein